MKNPVPAQKLSDMLSYARAPQHPPPVRLKERQLGFLDMAFKQAQDRAQKVVPQNYLDQVAIRMNVLGLQEMIIDLSNHGFVEDARRLVQDKLVPLEQEYGSLYLQ